MATIEITADEIFRNRLAHLGNETKRRLIELLVSSLTFSKREEDDHVLLSKIAGAWNGDGLTAEDEIRQLREDRLQGMTREIADLARIPGIVVENWIER